MFSHFKKDNSGNVVAFILVLAAVLVIGSFFFPKYKDKVGFMKDKQVNTVEYGLGLTSEFIPINGTSGTSGGGSAPHQNPLVVGITASPNKSFYSTEETISFAYSVSGGSGPYTATWNSAYSNGPTASGSYGSGVQFSNPGMKTISVSVSDSSNPRNARSKSITIKVFDPITASIKAINSADKEANKLLVGEQYYLEANVVQFDGRTYTCAWTIDGTRTNANCDQRLSIIKNSPTTVNTSLEVCDNTGDCKTFTRNFSVNYKPLEVEIIPFPNRDYIYYYELIRFSSTVVGGSGNYTYTWTDYNATTASGSFQQYNVGSQTIELEVCDNSSGTTACGRDTFTFDVLNRPPNQPTIAVSPNYPSGSANIPRNTNLTFSASGSVDPDGDTVSYQWKKDNEGWTSTPPNGGYSVGSHKVYVRAVDQHNGYSTSAIYEFSMINQLPTRPSFNCSGINCTVTSYGTHSMIYSDSPVTISLRGSTDADGDSIQYEYKLDSGSWSQNLPSFSSGRHTLTGRAVDNYGGKSQEVYFVFEVINRAPVLNSIIVRPNPPESADDIDYTVSVTEPDGDDYTVYWRLDEGGGFSSSEPSFKLSRGEHMIEAYVKDEGGLQSQTRSYTFTVLNTPPTLPTVTVNPTSGSRYTWFSFTANGSTDHDYDNITYEYKVDNGSWSSNPPNGYFSPGNHTLYVRVYDGHDYTNAQKNFTVTNQPPPTPTLTVSPSGAKYTNTNITFDASATDPDGDSLTYYWRMDNGSWSTTSPNGTFSLGTHTVEVRVYDGFSYSSIASSSFTVTNRTPSTPTISISPSGNLYPTTNVVFGASSTDPEGDNLTYYWKIDNGSWTTSRPDGNFALGNHTVYVYASDSFGNQSSFTSRTFTITTPPTSTINEDFEDGSFAYSNSGSWYLTSYQRYSGSYSFRSSNTSDYSTSSHTFYLSVPSNSSSSSISFDYLVRSEANWDYLRVYIDGVRIVNVSGYGSWTSYSQYAAPGLHTVKIEYYKDSSLSHYDDAAYIDNLKLTTNY